MINYYSIEPLLEKGKVFNAVYAGRGVGKTYSCLAKMVRENLHHIYLRRSDTELKGACNRVVHPYKSINVDMGTDYQIIPHSNMTSIIDNKTGEIMGYGLALSTYHNVKGADFSDIEWIIFDEFTRDPLSRPIKNEGNVFLNFYETVSRNREIKGKDPVRVIFLNNAVSIESDIMKVFGLQDVIESMATNGQKRFTSHEKSFAIEMIFSSEISELKKETSLYKAIGENGDFYKMAIENNFSNDSMYNVKRKNLIEYYPYCSYEDIYIYRHKSDGTYYISFIKADCPAYSKDTKALFRRNHYLPLKEAIISGKAFFQTYIMKCRLLKIMGIS